MERRPRPRPPSSASSQATTDPASSKFVEPEDRIATFDNDGTLWSEQPLYSQFYYILDRARELAAADPAWASTPVLKAAAAGDVQAIIAGGRDGLVELLGATGSGMTVEAFQLDAAEWLATARHPEKDRLFVDMVYQPMIELLKRSARQQLPRPSSSPAAAREFIRAFSDEKYGIPLAAGRWLRGRDRLQMSTASRRSCARQAWPSSTTARASPSASPATSASARSS